MTLLSAVKPILTPIDGCTIDLRQPYPGGPTAVILRFETAKRYGEWLDSPEGEDFQHQALIRGVDHLIYVSPEGVESFHRVKPRRRIGFKSRTPLPEPDYFEAF